MVMPATHAVPSKQLPAVVSSMGSTAKAVNVRAPTLPTGKLFLQRRGDPALFRLRTVRLLCAWQRLFVCAWS